ncbi:MAG: ATP-binding protein [Promethearchaeota archaeon]
MSDRLWYKAARNIVKAGPMPFPISNILLELLKTIITDEQAEFIVKVYSIRPNMSYEQVKEKVKDMSEESLNKMLDELQYNGIIAGTQSKSTGVMVYRLQPPFPGMFEFQLMRPGEGPREKKLAKLFDSLFKEMGVLTTKNYDKLIPQYKLFPPVDRVVPVEQEVQGGTDIILGKEDVNKIVAKYDDIALALCYCRHEKDLLDEPCKIDAPRTNCLLFGKTAKFCIEKDFANKITADEAIKILREAEDVGLVHKAFHIHQNPERDLEAICNCCNCCCGIFQLYNEGVMPFYTITNYLASVSKDDCSACGTCEEKCPMHAIKLIDAVAIVDDTICIGCGVCAHHCNFNAIHLKRFDEPRKVFVLPPKVPIEE